jgi:hypothetical protein
MTDKLIAAVSCLPNTTYDLSYVVFGKQGADPIELSAIATGTGGFVING